jgi:lysozyme family protein
MAREKAFVDAIIRTEGGYVFDPDDKGGETNYGITIATARRCGYQGAMKALHLEVAKQIYLKEYYFDHSFDNVKDDNLAFELMDTAVNMGPQTAVENLQKALNLLNDDYRFGEDLKVDGQLGKVTLTRVNNYPYPQRLFQLVNAIQCNRYVEIAQKNKQQRKFIFGWLNERVFKQLLGR